MGRRYEWVRLTTDAPLAPLVPCPLAVAEARWRRSDVISPRDSSGEMVVRRSAAGGGIWTELTPEEGTGEVSAALSPLLIKPATEEAGWLGRDPKGAAGRRSVPEGEREEGSRETRVCMRCWSLESLDWTDDMRVLPGVEAPIDPPIPLTPPMDPPIDPPIDAPVDLIELRKPVPGGLPLDPAPAPAPDPAPDPSQSNAAAAATSATSFAWLRRECTSINNSFRDFWMFSMSSC